MRELLTGYKYSGQMKQIEDFGNMNHIAETVINNFEYMLRTEGGYQGPEVTERLHQAGPAILEIAKTIFLEGNKQ